MTNNNNLKLSVTNFGPIVKADIDLRPLTVFVGPSNTGKSYAAILIYALHRLFNGDAIFPELRDTTIAASPFFAHGIIEGKDDAKISSDDIDLLATWANKIQRQLESNNYYIDVPRHVIRLFSSSMSLPGFEHPSANEIRRCFNVEDAQQLVRHNCRVDCTITIQKRQYSEDSRLIEPLKYYLVINNGQIQFTSSLTDRIPDRIVGTYRKTKYDDTLIRRLSAYDLDMDNTLSADDQEILRTVYGMPRYASNVLLPILAHIIGSAIVSPLDRVAYYLPADRAGVMHAHRTVVSSLISGASRAGLRAEAPRAVLSGVMADFLETLIGLGDLPTNSLSPYHTMSARLESGMLRGAIRSEASDIGYPVFSYQPEGWKKNIPLNNSSSMVSELAPVVLYLRHIVKPGEVLIIEEPESHLHPAMQVEFTRLLAAAVKSGVRVILTTHSEWVLEELANLVRLSELPESQRAVVGDADAALTPDDVGVWLFEPKKRPRGSVVKEIPLDLDIGSFPAGYDDVAVDTYNKWARIGNLIEETRDGS